MVQPDVASSLAAVGAAYRRFEAENAGLRAELQRGRLNVVPSPAVGEASLVVHAASGAVAGKATFDSEHTFSSRYAFRSALSDPDEMAVLAAKRNAGRAALQQLIADFDPDESGDWAQEELTPASCLAALQAHGKYEQTQESMQEIVDSFRAYYVSSAVPTQLQLVNLSSLSQLTEVFGATRVEGVMELQDSLQWSIKNRLISENFDHADVGAKPSKCAELWEAFRPTSALGWVEAFGVSLVVANVVLLGISSDVHRGWFGWDIISTVFAIAHTAELLVRVGLSGGVRAFFGGQRRAWNIFEALVVMLTLLDVFVLLFATGEHSTRATMVCRVIRLFRLTRISRLARTGLFHELTFMLRGVESGRSTLLWGFLLVILMCYTGAVALTQTIGRVTDAQFGPYVDAHFGSTFSSMFTLFFCFTGSCSAYDGRPLGFILFQYYGAFTVVVYMLVFFMVSFGLLCVLIASFLQSSMRASRFSDVERRRVLKKERKMIKSKTQLLLGMILQHCLKRPAASELDTAEALRDIRISRSMYRQLLRDPEIQQWLEDMGCEDGLRVKLFDKIDRDGNGVLECTELVTGIVDLLRGRLDNMEALTALVRSVDRRLIELEAITVLGQGGGLGTTSEVATSDSVAI